MAEGFLGGLGDFVTGGGVYSDPKAINPTYGVPEGDVRQAAINQLGQMSALLLAAGQPMEGSQRAQLLSQIGGTGNQFNTNLYNAAQRRLMTSQMQEKQKELEETNVLRELQQKDPQKLAQTLGPSFTADMVKNLPISSLRDVAKNILVSQANPIAQEQYKELVGKRERKAAFESTIDADPNLTPAQKLAAKADPDTYAKNIFANRKQFAESTRMIDDKPVLGQIDLQTGKWEPYSKGGVSVNIGEKGASEIDVERIKRAQKLSENLASVEGPLSIAQTQLMGGLGTGSINSATIGIRNYLASAGLMPKEEADKLSSEQLFNSVSNFIIPRMRAEGSGGTSNFESQKFEEAAPSLSKTPQGNLLIASYLKQNIEREREYARAMDKWFREKKGLGGFDEWAEQNIKPVVTSVNSIEDYKALKRGKMYYSPDAGTFLIKKED